MHVVYDEDNGKVLSRTAAVREVEYYLGFFLEKEAWEKWEEAKMGFRVEKNGGGRE
jgi:hypothetical protein